MLRHMNDNDILRIILDATFLNPKNEKKHQKIWVHSWHLPISQPFQVAPDDLYASGVNRETFMPFIDTLRRRTVTGF